MGDNLLCLVLVTALMVSFVFSARAMTLTLVHVSEIRVERAIITFRTIIYIIIITLPATTTIATIHTATATTIIMIITTIAVF